MTTQQNLFQNLHVTKALNLIQECKWQDIIQFILNTSQGKEEVKVAGIDLLYTAVKYRAPVDLLILLFNLLERENDQQITLDPTLLRKALYQPQNVCRDRYLKTWEHSERIEIASFLSNKISQ